MKYLSLICALFLMSGCVSLNSVSLTSIPVAKGQKVRSESERFIFMGFNFDNDYVNTITMDLKQQCPNGTVSGLLTKSESINYFLFIFWKSRITSTGYCVPNKMASEKSDKKRRPSDNESATEREI